MPRLEAQDGARRLALVRGVHRVPIALALSLALMLAACQTRMASPPSLEVRQQLQGAAVAVHHDSLARADVQTPVAGKGKAAAVSAGGWALGSASSCVYLPSGLAGAIYCGIGLADGVVGAPVAAVVAAIRVHDEDEVRAAAASFHAALAEVKPAAGLARELMTAVQKVPSVHLEAISMEHPADDNLGGNGRRSGVTLDVSVFDLEIRSEGRTEPDVTLAMKVTARVIPAAGGAELYWRRWEYESVERDYFELAADNAAAFRAEVQTAYRALAEKMVQDLFVSTMPEEIEDAPSEGGRAWTIDGSSASDAST